MKIRVLRRDTLEELTSFGDGGRQPGQFYARAQHRDRFEGQPLHDGNLRREARAEVLVQGAEGRVEAGTGDGVAAMSMRTKTTLGFLIVAAIAWRVHWRPALREPCDRAALGTGGAGEQRVADLRGDAGEHALLAARSDQRGELRHARSGVAVQDRQPRPAAGVQLPVHAADGRRRALHDRRARAAPSWRSTPRPAR